MYKVFRLFLKQIEIIINNIMFKHFGVIIKGSKKGFKGFITIRTGKKGSIVIGDNVKINSGKNYNIIGGDTRLILRTIDSGQIIIGDNVGISNSAIVSKNKIIIENNVYIGASCAIYDTDFHSLSFEERMMNNDLGVKSAPIKIKKGAFIGAHSIILKGVTIGENSIIGAGSVVTKNIPDNEVWGGDPVKYIRDL